MAIVDHAVIFVRSGKGGHGCMSMRREKYVPKGGPDGGDGGDGGDVILVTDDSVDTLLGLTHRPHRRAKSGKPGEGKSKHGADGEDCLVPVPVGTLVYDHETGERIADLDQPEQKLVVAKGGKGGYGNEHFKSATNQTPRNATEGGPWEEKTLRLELKLIADVGLVGLPNAGKSTMLSAVSHAHPKIADYPFTTVQPHLGIAELPGERRIVMADIPGLIRGAADGAGLGHDFLRHIERTTVLLHLLDVAPVDGSDPAENYFAIRRELTEYAAELAEKREIVAFNKVDLLADDEAETTISALAGKIGLPADEKPLIVSGATGHGVKAMLEACWSALGREVEHAGWPPRKG